MILLFLCLFIFISPFILPLLRSRHTDFLRQWQSAACRDMRQLFPRRICFCWFKSTKCHLVKATTSNKSPNTEKDDFWLLGRIIPFSKQLATMVIVSPLTTVSTPKKDHKIYVRSRSIPYEKNKTKTLFPSSKRDICFGNVQHKKHQVLEVLSYWQIALHLAETCE